MPRGVRIELRQGTYDEWALKNPRLAYGEPAYETDTGNSKIGDGIHSYNDLPYSVENDKEIRLESCVETFLQTTSAASTSSPSVNHTKGNLIAVFAGYYGNSGSFTVTDTQGNTYQAAGSNFTLSMGVTGNWFWAYAKSTGANVVTANHPNNGYRTIKVLEYSGISCTNPVDVYTAGSGATSPSFSTQTAKELILAAWHTEGVTSFREDAGFEHTLTSGAMGTATVRRVVEQKITKSVQTNQTLAIGNVNGVISGGWIVAFRKKPPIEITTVGQTFAPIIKTSGDCTVLWTFSDGTTSSSLTPSKDFGTAATRKHTLVVTPWTALTHINFGYTADDGGLEFNRTTINTLANQNVSVITGLENVSRSLKEFAASNNPLTSLNFKNFVKLAVVECYYCLSLASIDLTNTPNLGRLCVEGCHLSVLDLSMSPNMGDLRGAMQSATSFRVIWGNINKMWHICIHTNPFNAETRIQPWRQFPLIREIYYGGNHLTQAEVDDLFAAVDSFGTSWTGYSPFIHAEGSNATPSAEGLAHIANLTARGWNITHA